MGKNYANAQSVCSCRGIRYSDVAAGQLSFYSAHGAQVAALALGLCDQRSDYFRDQAETSLIGHRGRPRSELLSLSRVSDVVTRSMQM